VPPIFQPLVPILPNPPPPPIDTLDPDLDLSRDSISSNEEAEADEADEILMAPLSRVGLENIIQRRIQDDVDNYWKRRVHARLLCKFDN
jgi:hypothetical protein